MSIASTTASHKTKAGARTLQNHTLDSTRWDGFRFRAGDIVIGTWAKAGTTWLQQIVAQLVLPETDGVAILDISPWIDQRCFPSEPMFRMLEAQTHQRFVKTHLPADSLNFSPLARYIYAARDGRDALWSWYNHHRRMTKHAIDFMNAVPDRVGPPFEPACEDVGRYFHEFLDRNGYPLWPFWSHIQSWWDIRDRSNVLLIHFNGLKSDLQAEIRRIARFLGITIAPHRWPQILQRCSFEYMKSRASTLSPTLDRAFEGGASSFFDRGINGRWRDVLSSSDIRKYERSARRNLSGDCAHWLATGRTPEPVVLPSDPVTFLSPKSHPRDTPNP